MSDVGQLALAAVLAYLLGSLAFGYWIYKLWRGQDIRATGSGNVGATNVFRAAGPAAGAATLLLDAAKGYAALLLCRTLIADTPGVAAVAAVMAVVGHSYPVLLRFRGGKGVATGMGAFLAIEPAAVLLCAVVFAIVAAASRYVSLASITAVAVFPVVLLLTQTETPGAVLAAAVVAAALIIARHRSNIQRLLSGSERPIAGRGKA